MRSFRAGSEGNRSTHTRLTRPFGRYWEVPGSLANVANEGGSGAVFETAALDRTRRPHRGPVYRRRGPAPTSAKAGLLGPATPTEKRLHAMRGVLASC